MKTNEWELKNGNISKLRFLQYSSGFKEADIAEI